MYWLLAIIFSYLFFSFSSLGDKLILSGKPQPKTYTFYTGILGGSVVLLIPFVAFRLPDSLGMLWIMLYAIVHVIGVYAMFSAVKKYDVSRVVATIGATQPVFIFLLTNIFFGFQSITTMNAVAFIMLLLGTIIISIEKDFILTARYLKVTIFSSFMFSLEYLFTKMIFSSQPFLQGVIWMGIGIFIGVLFLLFQKKAREEIFSRHIVLHKKTQIIFFVTQICGGMATFLQSFAIFLAPVAFLAVMNSLRGLQYIFLFLTTLLLSIFSPRILQEAVHKKAVAQKMVSITVMAIGLSMIVLN